MDPSKTMLPNLVQTPSFPSSCSSPLSRSPPTSTASASFDASSFCSSSGLIETQYPTISQFIDCAAPSSSSSQSTPFQVTPSSSSPTLEPKLECLQGVSNKSLNILSPSAESFSCAGVVVDIPRPLELLLRSPITPFLSKTYEIVNDPSLDRIVSWSPAGQSFVVWDPIEFSRIVLPRHFKHSNFSSFLRQLNTYGFRKIDGDRLEFANEEFLRGKRTLLRNINRRRSPRVQPKVPFLGSSMGMELLGVEDELQKLRSEKYMLMQEVLKMKQEHLVTIKEMDNLNRRLQSAELRQKQMIAFWVKVLRNPVFLMQLKQSKKLREISSVRSTKASLEYEQPSEDCMNKSRTRQIVKYRQSFCEPDSIFALQDLESSSETQQTDHLLQAMSVERGPVLMIKDGSSNKPLEMTEPSFNQNASIKWKNIMISGEDASLGSADFYVSSPEEMAKASIFSLGKCSAQPVLQIDKINSKSVGEIQGDKECHTEYLASAVNVVEEIGCKEEFWDVDFEAGRSFNSEHDVRDNIFCINPVVPGDEIGLSEMWDIGSHFNDGFDIDKWIGREFLLLPDMDEDVLRDDHTKNSGS
ncbi:heat stress transcription factor A-3-like [Phalaenopsis equestris]|uniref:heat stress transcription factor A-3-like n=1 Tax=Phalaenopsis equestris TaxID=78828 RepID=UPI0009E504B4|nr:heat stress transcription factor A-3-like [Phalaenopsis equestris]